MASFVVTCLLGFPMYLPGFKVNTDIYGEMAMASNGISTLQYKRDRQVAKLDLAQQKRIAQNASPKEGLYAHTTRKTDYDLNLLPSVYATGNNDTNDRVINGGPLQQNRPWF